MSNPTEPAVREALFWKLAQAMIASGRAERGTMMGFPCLRANGQFFASLEKATSHLIVKLPATRVADLIRERAGTPFAPNGRAFREWVAIPDADEDTWRTLLRDAREFADA